LPLRLVILRVSLLPSLLRQFSFRPNALDATRLIEIGALHLKKENKIMSDLIDIEECEFCGLEFDTPKELEDHEDVCEDNPENA
jgi:hypothetical protein